MSKKYVPEGAYLACSKGTCPSQLRVSNNEKTSIYGAAMATEADMFPFFNLKPMGFCTDIKKIASTGIMCLPTILKWEDPKQGVTINGKKMLLEDSTCKCILGDGDISIHFDVTSANKVALWGGAKMPTEYIKEGFDWAFANINEDRAARDAMLPSWAQGVAHVGDWFQDLSVSLVEGAVTGVVGLGEVIYQVGQDPVGMTEAIGGMLNDAHKWKTEKEMQAIAWASKGENWSNAADSLWKTATETDWTQAVADGASATWQGTKDVANWVADNPRKIGETVGEFIPDVVVAVYSGGTSLAATAGKKAVKEVGEEIVEEAVEKAVKETVEEGLEAGGKKALKEGIEKIGKEEADDIAKVVAKTDPPGTTRNSIGQLIDEKTGKYAKNPNSLKYNRSMAERKKALLRDADDLTNDLSPRARKQIKDSNGNKVPTGYEVDHEIPLYTAKTEEGKALLDKSTNMKTMQKHKHRKLHIKCNKMKYHKYPPKNYR